MPERPNVATPTRSAMIADAKSRPLRLRRETIAPATASAVATTAPYAAQRSVPNPQPNDHQPQRYPNPEKIAANAQRIANTKL
jgi:hypothetical protein